MRNVWKTMYMALFAMSGIVAAQEASAHPGRCRSDSPPGQCCHMEHATGIVHCHGFGKGNYITQ